MEKNPMHELIMDEADLLHLTIPAIGNAYKEFLNNYNPPGELGYRDRGYGSAVGLLELISVVPSDDYPDISEEEGYFNRFRELTKEEAFYIPAMATELEIIDRLRKDYLNPVRELVLNVGRTLDKRNGRFVFTPDEFVEFSYTINTIRTYMDYRAGRNYLNQKCIVEDKPIDVVVSRQLSSLNAFNNKWNTHWRLYGGSGGVDQFGLITLAIVDSMDGSIIADAIESENPHRVLLNDTPYNGLNNIIMNPTNFDMKEVMRTSLETDSDAHTFCIPQMLRKRGNRGDYLKYVKKLNKKLKKNDNAQINIV